MATLANDEVYEVRIFCDFDNQVSVNTLHYKIAAVVGAPSEDQLAEAMDATFSGPLGDCLNENAHYAGIGVSRIDPLPRRLTVYNNLGEGNGGVLGDPLPKQVCGVITKLTVNAGAHWRGRMYVPFPSESSNDPTTGHPAAAYLTSLEALATLLDNTIAVGAGGNTANAQPVLFQRETDSFTSITGHRRRLIWGTQRRRGDYGRINALPEELR